jgi:alkaline phosphatase D
VVVLTGDIHAAGVGNLVGENPDGTSATRVYGTELVASSISSNFDSALADVAQALIAQLPHIRFADTKHRGYMISEASDTEVVTRLRVVDSIASPNEPVYTIGEWTTLAGTPGVQPA